MKESTSKSVQINTTSALKLVMDNRQMERYAAYIGLDVHKETIAIAIAKPGRGDAEYFKDISNKPNSIRKMVNQLNERFGGEVLLFSYEAGPCGYDLYRQLTEMGQDCEVVAPSLIPQKAGVRVKTDKRDAIGLARYSRAGELTPVWVPSLEQEAIRDLTRAREDMKAIETKAKQRLGAFLLRHGKRYESGKKRWTLTYFNWLEQVKFDNPYQQITLQEYIDAVKEAVKRVDGLIKHMHNALDGWSLRPVVEGLIALRGIDVLTAMTVMAELGDISRFDSPRQLMAFLGLVPNEHSSGNRRTQGGITKTGNSHVRRLLVESGWSYRYPARKTEHLRRKASQASDTVKVIAWEAQKRLCGRYRKLIERGKVKQVACTAVARELVGFIWAVVCEVLGKPHASRSVCY